MKKKNISVNTGKKSGRKKFMGLFALSALATLVAGCKLFTPDENIPEPIYGPPEMLDPANNIPEEIYGPPEMLEDYYQGKKYQSQEDYYEDLKNVEEEDSEDYDPSLAEVELLYGPPVDGE